jgi:hypothetical protein
LKVPSRPITPKAGGRPGAAVPLPGATGRRRTRNKRAVPEMGVRA